MENLDRSIKEFESNTAHLDSFPSMLFVELTENCNCRCPMCRPNYKNSPLSNMPFSLYKRVADALFPHAKYVDFRGWGESLTIPHFVKYIDYAKKFDANFKIITNLAVKNEEILKYLAANDFLIGISFDAANRTLFNSIRKGSDFDIVFKNLKLLKSYFLRFDRNFNNVYFTTTVNSFNIDNIQEIIKLANEIGISKIKLCPVIVPSKNPLSLITKKDEIMKNLDKVKDLSENVNLELNASLHEDLSLEFATHKRCIHPWMYCYINHKGDIGFCDHLIGPWSSCYLLGSIKKGDFKNIWNCEKAIRLRTQHIMWRKGISDEFNDCNWCYKNRYIDLENIIYPAYSKYVVPEKNLLGGDKKIFYETPSS